MEFSIFKWKKQELVFVLLVVAGIWGLSYFQMKTAAMKTRDAQRKADAELVGRALQRYYEDYKEYPMATESGKINACGRMGAEPCEWGKSDIVDNEDVVYLKKIPIDPLSGTGRTYIYTTDEKRLHFRIYAALEYSRDSDWKKGLEIQCGNNVQCNWYVEN